jgi:hypothetical protein
MPSHFGRCNACLRQSQQVCEIPPFDPKSPILLRLENAFYNFKESPIPIIEHKPDPANLIITLDPAFQASRTNATRYRLDPANDTGKPHDATRSTRYHVTHTASQPATQPSGYTIYNATRSRLTAQADNSTAHRHGTA